MTIKLGTKFLARAVGAAALLGVVLVAGGVVTSPKITLSDGSRTLDCVLVADPTGVTGSDWTANVAPGCLGFSTLTVTKSGTGATTGVVTNTVTTATPAGGINCGTDCSEPYNNGTLVTLHASGPTGTNFTGWTDATCSASGTADCTLTLTNATTVNAGFTAPPTLTVVKAGTGSGAITGAGISCGTAGTDCTELYGSPIVLTATPGSGSTFAGWSGGGCSGTGSTCTPTLTVSGTVTATFNGSCSTPPAAGRVVSIVETGLITSNWAKRTFSPLPSTITAFHVNVPPSGFTRRDDIVAIKGSTSPRAPMMILSTQPGCADAFQAQLACKISALDGAKIKVSGNLADTVYYCKLPPGDYYVNAFNQATVGGAYTCTNTTNCTFYATRSLNY